MKYIRIQLNNYGNERLKVVGLRINEVECQGDYSGVGMDNSKAWLSLNGLMK